MLFLAFKFIGHSAQEAATGIGSKSLLEVLIPKFISNHLGRAQMIGPCPKWFGIQKPPRKPLQCNKLPQGYLSKSRGSGEFVSSMSDSFF